jgi:hypothetical protein
MAFGLQREIAQHEVKFSMGFCLMVWARCAGRNLETPSWMLGSNLSCSPPAETKPFPLEGNPHCLLPEICFLWNFMAHWVSCNHFLNEDYSSWLSSFASHTWYYPFIGSEKRKWACLFLSPLCFEVLTYPWPIGPCYTGSQPPFMFSFLGFYKALYKGLSF